MKCISKEQPKALKPMVQTNRYIFTVSKDIALLKSCLQHNPWQLGNERWQEVKKDMIDEFEDVRVRALKDHVKLLLTRLNSEQLVYKTGTEEQATEKGDLLEAIKAIVEEDGIPINSNLDGSEDNSNRIQLTDVMFTQNELDEATISAAEKKSEKINADSERNELLSKMAKAPSPNEHRRKRSRLSHDEELIGQKFEHEMEMEKLRHQLEETKQKNSFVLASSQIELEKSKLDFEVQKESRLLEESRRRDDIALTQLKMQDTMCQLMLKFSKNERCTF